ALEALDDDGSLTLRTRAAERGFLETTVEDTGCGMSDETRARAFDLFFTTKDTGTGLGMAIARSVIEQHGGRIEIRSQIGRGTQVRVLLPVEAPGNPRGWWWTTSPRSRSLSASSSSGTATW